MNPIFIASPKQKQKLAPIQSLNATLSSHSLFNYEELLQRNSPYNASKFRLDKLHLQKWMKTKGAEEETVEESEHDSVVEEDEDSKQREGTPAAGCPRSILEFYKKYKGMNKSSVQSTDITTSSTIKYLKKIEQLHHIPQPMGIAKWNGSPADLNLA